MVLVVKISDHLKNTQFSQIDIQFQTTEEATFRELLYAPEVSLYFSLYRINPLNEDLRFQINCNVERTNQCIM